MLKPANVVVPVDLLSLDILIVSERPDHLHTLVRILDASSARVSACFSIRQAQDIFARQPVDLVFCDEYLSDGSYRDLLISSRFGQAASRFVLLLRVGEWEEYLAAMRLGALDVLRCPLQQPEVESILERALHMKEQRNASQAPAAVFPQESAVVPQDLHFEQLLERAAATLSPKSTPATSPGQPAEQRPPAIRNEDVA